MQFRSNFFSKIDLAGKYIKLQQQFERTQNYILNKVNNY